MSAYTRAGNFIHKDGQLVGEWDPDTRSFRSPVRLHHKVKLAVENVLDDTVKHWLSEPAVEGAEPVDPAAVAAARASSVRRSVSSAPKRPRSTIKIPRACAATSPSAARSCPAASPAPAPSTSAPWPSPSSARARWLYFPTSRAKAW